MFAFRRSRVPLESVIEDLPDGYHTVAFGDGHLVVGPTGAFAIASGSGDVDGVARRLVAAASQLRDMLCARLSWAPFVDTLVVVDDHADRTRAASVVPRRLLREVLTEGNEQLGHDQVERIVATVREHRPVALT